jgi:hypothetical protein
MEYLADQPDPEVGEVFAVVLESYGARPARFLRERLAARQRSA